MELQSEMVRSLHPRFSSLHNVVGPWRLRSYSIRTLYLDVLNRVITAVTLVRLGNKGDDT